MSHVCRDLIPGEACLCRTSAGASKPSALANCDFECLTVLCSVAVPGSVDAAAEVARRAAPALPPLQRGLMHKLMANLANNPADHKFRWGLLARMNTGPLSVASSGGGCLPA